MELIDIGVNLTGSSFKRDLDAVIERAQQAGVMHMVVTGTDVEHSEAALKMCADYPGYLTCTAGVHPHHADAFDAAIYEQLEVLLQNDQVVASGECGLDYNRNFSERSNQIRAFEQQLELGRQCGKPVFLHQRDAHEDFLAIMRDAIGDLSGGVAHCFTGTPQQAEAYLDIGLDIGVTGWVCDERRGHDLREAVKVIPPERLLLETDAPYLLPRDLPERIPGCGDYRPADKRRNEPAFLQHVCDSVARLMGVDAAELAVQTSLNARRLFGI